MRRALASSALLTAALLAGSSLGAADQLADDQLPPVLQRFLSSPGEGPTAYRARRRLEARNGRLKEAAWMDVWTEADKSGFRYEIIGEGGSGYVRERVFVSALETEARMWGGGARGALTLDNYIFEDRGAEASGLAWIQVTPRRKDVLLVNGSIFLRPDDAELIRVEGTLSKTPSFWTRKVEIVRTYARIGGVRVPVRLESVASIRVAGQSTMTMTYDYESVNGETVGSPAATGQP